MTGKWSFGAGDIEEFDSSPWCNVANILTAYDDPLMALKVLDMVPAYYRDHRDYKIEELRNKILRQLVTPVWYANQEKGICAPEVGQEVIEKTLRGHLLHEDVKLLNSKNYKPHIIDLAPGTYWIAQGLQKLGLSFTYEPIDFGAIRPELAGKTGEPIIFCALELIEHLHHEEDIKTEILRIGLIPDIVHISTPRYTYDGRKVSLNWENKDLGHLRTYTPREFVDCVKRMFPGFEFLLYEDVVMHMKGQKYGNKFL